MRPGRRHRRFRPWLTATLALAARVVLALVLAQGRAAAQLAPVGPVGPVEPIPLPAAALADAHLAGLIAALEDCASGFSEHWSRRAYAACDSTLTLLAVFEDRFGVDPRSLAAWPELHVAAARALERVSAISMDPGNALLLPDDDRSTYAFHEPESGRRLVQASLLGVLGRYDEATALAATVDPSANDGCIDCSFDNAMVLAQRHSEIAEQRGELSVALHFQLLAVSGFGSVAEGDWMQYRCGRLLERLGHAAEARAVWAKLADRKSVDDETRRLVVARLEQEPARSFPAAVLVREAHGRASLLAVAPAGETGGLRLLTAWLPEERSILGSPITLVQPDLASSRARLVELLDPSRWHGRWEGPSWALTALSSLPGDTLALLPGFLRSFGASGATAEEQRRVRVALVRVLGGEARGSDAQAELTNAEFAQAWLERVSAR